MSTNLPGRIAPLIAATACWGVGTVLTKQVLGSIDPLTLLPLQLSASCLFLLAALRIGRVRVVRTPELTRLAWLGVLNPGLAYALGLAGLAGITASMSVLLWAVEPVLILLLAAALLRERAPLVVYAAVAVAVLGVLLVVYAPGAAGDGIGVALTLGAVCACALYTVLVRRLLVDDASLPVIVTQQAAALGFASALLVVVRFFDGQGWSPLALSPGMWAAAAASGVVYYGAAFWLFVAGLRQVPASVAGGVLPLIPVFGVAAGWVAGDRLGPRQWLGAVVVVLAALVVARRGSTP